MASGLNVYKYYSFDHVVLWIELSVEGLRHLEFVTKLDTNDPIV